MENRKRTLNESRRIARQKKIKQRRRRRAAVLIFEILLLCVLSVSAFALFKYGKLDLRTLNNVTNNGIEQEGYTNVALFGTDNRAGEVEGVRSDTIIIASINNKTKEVKMMSVYRDTLLLQNDGYYNKANSAYASGGPEAAVNMLNRNLDLDIKDYATVNFLALADVVDLLGGLEITMTYEEVCHMNNYCVETSEITGKDYTPIDPEAAGTYLLNGVQTVSYCRIRYTDGGDFERAERQRLVIEKIIEKAKSSKLSVLNEIIDAVLPQVSTNFTVSEILKLAADILEYSIGESKGFPFDSEATDMIEGYTGSYVVPIGLENNVRQAHEFLFSDVQYVPTEMVTHISNEISYISGIYPVEQVEEEEIEEIIEEIQVEEQNTDEIN